MTRPPARRPPRPVDGRAGYDPLARNETPLERCDRNLVELLQEVRVVQTGVQVVFAFLLTAPLAPRFPELTPFQRYDYFVTLLAARRRRCPVDRSDGLPPHPVPLGDKEYLVLIANRFTLAGLAFVAGSMVGALLLVRDLMFDDTAVIATGRSGHSAA